MIQSVFMLLCLIGMGLLLIWNDSEHRKTITKLWELIAEQEREIEILEERCIGWQRSFYHDGFFEEE